MTLGEIKTIGVAGAGTMGAGIAQVCAQAGYPVVLFDIQPAMLEKARAGIDKNLRYLVDKGSLQPAEKEAIEARIRFTPELETVKADLIIEAVVERLEVKHDLFGKLAALNKPGTILATNTSSIPITQIAARIPGPDRVVGIHFFNPAHIMKLVEVISGAETAPEVAETSRLFVQQIGKKGIMAKDAPGFIVNRVARHYYVEALKILEENVTSFEDLDMLLESAGFKMGPFRLMDLIGVDTNFSVTSSMYQLFHYDGKFRPSRIQQQKVDAGHHGRKTGRGFYRYD